MPDPTPEPVPGAIARAIASVVPPDEDWSLRAAARQARLTMPPGSLGRLLDVGRQLASIQRTDRPIGSPALIAVFAADHGIAAEGVSAYPTEVTGQMVANYLRGGAAVNVLARRADADVSVVDLGVAHRPAVVGHQGPPVPSSVSPGADSPPTPTLPHKGGGSQRIPTPTPSLPPCGGGSQQKPSPLVGEGWVGGSPHEGQRLSAAADGLISRPIRPGTSNFADGPAMTRAEAFQAFNVGLELADRWARSEGYRIIALGEMGIGNSTTAAALVAALTGAEAGAVTGRGTGIDEETWIRKRDMIDWALRLHGPACHDLWDWLSRIGGFEIIGLAGLAIGAAGAGAAVVLDGLISTAAGLVAARLCPAVVGFLIAAHRGAEPGQVNALRALGLEPILDLGLRLGEGSGAALALPMIASSADILREMATFDEAGVSGPIPGTS